MKRPPHHITDSRGKAQLREVFESLGWVVNEIPEDYGVDFDIQIFQDGKATGEWFKVQLKSSESTSYSASHDSISQQLEYTHAVHYSTEIRAPMFLMHADVENQKTFWHAPQLDPRLANLALLPDPPSSVTVRIPTSNALPDSLPQMLTALERIQILRGARTIADASIGEFTSTIRKHGDQKRLYQEFKNKLDALALHKAHDLFRSGLHSAARQKLDNILRDTDSSIESKFSATLEKEQIDWHKGATTGTPQSELPKIRLEASKNLQALTKKGPASFKFFALIARKAAELEILTFRDFGLYMNWRNQLEAGNPIIALNLYIERVISANRVARKYNQCVRLARSAARSVHAWALPLALLRIVVGIVSFTIRLESDKDVESVDAYTRSAIQICRLAGQIAATFQDDDALYRVVATSMLLYPKSPEKAMKCAQAALEEIHDPDAKKPAQEILDRGLARFRGERLEGDRPATHAQIYENMAAASGIDMGDPNNPLTRLVRLGIKDEDPNRVLKECEHSFVSLSGRVSLVKRMLAEHLNLPSIGAKIIHCVLHDYAVESHSLDDAFQCFKAKYCEKCPDRSPHPADWKWSDEWQQEENRKHKEFVSKLRKRRQ